MDHFADPLCGSHFCNPLRAIRLDRGKFVFTAFVQNTHTVHNRITASHHRRDRGVIADIAQDRFDLTNSAVSFDKNSLVWASNCNANTPPCLCHTTGDITPNKSGSAKNCDQLCHVFPSAFINSFVITAHFPVKQDECAQDNHIRLSECNECSA